MRFEYRSAGVEFQSMSPAVIRHCADKGCRPDSHCISKRNDRNQYIVIMIRTLLFVIVILLLIGSLPAWPYRGGWGYYPSGGLGTILIVLLIWLLRPLSGSAMGFR